MVVPNSVNITRKVGKGFIIFKPTITCLLCLLLFTEGIRAITQTLKTKLYHFLHYLQTKILNHNLPFNFDLPDFWQHFEPEYGSESCVGPGVWPELGQVHT